MFGIFKVYAIGFPQVPLLPICEGCYKIMDVGTRGIKISYRYYHFHWRCVKFWNKPGYDEADD